MLPEHLQNPKTREDLVELAKLIHAEFDKIHRLTDEAIARCVVAKELEKHSR